MKNNTDYQVDWYSFGEGYYLESDCQNTVGKKFKLKHPTLNTTFDERPIVWFVIKQNNCDNKMAISDELELKENIHIHDSTGIIELELSINEENIEYKKVKVYPNPFTDEIFIEINNPDELTIKSLSGIVVFESSISKGKQAIELSNLASGVYFISFKNQNSIFKIMKQ